MASDGRTARTSVNHKSEAQRSDKTTGWSSVKNKLRIVEGRTNICSRVFLLSPSGKLDVLERINREAAEAVSSGVKKELCAITPSMLKRPKQPF